MAPRPEVTDSWHINEVWSLIEKTLGESDPQGAYEARNEIIRRYLVGGRVVLTHKQANDIMRRDQGRYSLFESRFTQAPDFLLTLIGEHQISEAGDGMLVALLNDQLYVFTMVDSDEQVDHDLTEDLKEVARASDDSR